MNNGEQIASREIEIELNAYLRRRLGQLLLAENGRLYVDVTMMDDAANTLHRINEEEDAEDARLMESPRNDGSRL